MSKFKSRKFWIAVGTVFAIAIAELTGYDVDPAALAGIVIAASTYVFSQGLVDKSVVAEQVKVAGDVGRAQLEAYARNLETQLTAVTNQLQVPTELASVPDEE